MRNSDLAADDPETVHIWVTRIHGSKTELGARADRELAQAWVERRIDENGEWTDGEQGCRELYRTNGPDTGSIELVPLYDVMGMVLKHK